MMGGGLADQEARGRRSRRRSVLAVALAATVTALLAGCSGQGGSAKPSTGPSATQSSPGGGGVPTGTQLLALLPYHDHQPAGWELDPTTGSVSSSGGSPQTPVGPPSSQQCTYVAIPNSPMALIMNFWGVSWAVSTMQQVTGQGNVSMGLGAFQPGYAQRQIDWYAAEAVSCHVYNVDGGPVTTTSSAVPGLGDQALYLQNVISGSDGYTQQELMARVGNNMAVLYQTSAFEPLLPPSQLESMAQVLVQRLDTLSGAAS
jgi:hypothetical protein